MIQKSFFQKKKAPLSVFARKDAIFFGKNLKCSHNLFLGYLWWIDARRH